MSSVRESFSPDTLTPSESKCPRLSIKILNFLSITLSLTCRLRGLQEAVARSILRIKLSGRAEFTQKTITKVLTANATQMSIIQANNGGERKKVNPTFPQQPRPTPGCSNLCSHQRHHIPISSSQDSRIGRISFQKERK